MTRREMERKAIWVARHYDARFGHEVEVRYDDEYLYQVAPEMNLFRRVRRSIRSPHRSRSPAASNGSRARMSGTPAKVLA